MRWSSLRLPLFAACLLLADGGQPARAEKTDRSRPMTVEAALPGSIDLQRQVVVFNGDVVITQGTLSIRAERVEVRETPGGYQSATAIGRPGRPASYRQRRDGVDEWIEARADRIEYDGRNETLRFVGNAEVRRLRGSVTADEISGALILWDHGTEVFSVEGGAATDSNPRGRVRAVLSPRPDAAAVPAGAAPPKPGRPVGDSK